MAWVLQFFQTSASLFLSLKSYKFQILTVLFTQGKNSTSVVPVQVYAGRRTSEPHLRFSWKWPPGTGCCTWCRCTPDHHVGWWGIHCPPLPCPSLRSWTCQSQTCRCHPGSSDLSEPENTDRVEIKLNATSLQKWPATFSHITSHASVHVHILRSSKCSSGRNIVTWASTNRRKNNFKCFINLNLAFSIVHKT